MKKASAARSALLLGLIPAAAASGQGVNAELVGHWDGYTGTYADIWGDGDYAYICHYLHHGVNIIDISNPASPVALTEWLVPGQAGGSAQDVMVDEGLLYIGIESGSESVEIVDVRNPASPAHVAMVDVPGFRSIHNVFFYAGYLYMCDSNTNRVGIIDLTGLDPDNPPPGPITAAKWIMQNVGSSFVHDVTVVGSRLYASAWDSGLWIYDVTDVANQAPTFLGQTPDGGDNTHSCWPSGNGDYVVTGEERTGGGIKVYRITDNGGSLTLQLTDTFALPPAAASSVHNQVMIGYRLYNSWYQAGLQVFDIDPATGLLQFAASFDTPGQVWGVYPLLGPSRVLLSDMGNGLYVVGVTVPAGDLDGDGVVGIGDFLGLLASWGPCPGVCPPSCPADLDDDCNVGITDFLTLLANWT